MSTIRAFVKNNRVSTARQIDSSTFQQFFPAKVSYKNEAEWKDLVKRFYGSDKVTFKFQVTTPSVTRSSAPAPSPAPAPAPAPASLRTKKNRFESFLNMNDWQFSSKLSQTLPPGKYWIGDICYCLDDKVYDTIFGGFGYDGGFYTHKDGGFFMVDGTAWGDGAYAGSDGFTYGVDAGIIGIVSHQLVDENNDSLCGGKFHTFTEPVKCTFKGGRFEFISGFNFFQIET